MKCPNCGTAESRVKKTIIQIEEMGGPVGFEFGDLKQRHRQCLSCGARFQTYEVHESVFLLLKALHEGKQPPRRALKLAPPPILRAIDHRRSLDDD